MGMAIFYAFNNTIMELYFFLEDAFNKFRVIPQSLVKSKRKTGTFSAPKNSHYFMLWKISVTTFSFQGNRG